MSDYLITGGAGFIGAHIAERLLRDGARVRILDNYSTGSRETTARLARCYGSGLEVVEGDVGEIEDCRRAAAGVRWVSHHAALASVPASIADPHTTHRTNAAGTLNLLLAARDAGAKRFIYASTSATYGALPDLPKREDMPPDLQSPYAVSKYMGEEFARLFQEQFGLETIRLRYFNVYGPGQDPHSPYAAVIPSFLGRLLAGQQPVIYGDGRQTRDFIYVSDVVAANLLALNANGVCGVYNIACGQRTDLFTLLAAIENELGVNIAARHEPARPGDVHDSAADIGLAKNALGFSPQVSLADGLRPTVAYFRSLIAK